MSETNALVKMLAYSYLDFDNAFSGISAKDLHKRPAQEALAISELAGHIAYCEAGAIFQTLLGKPQSQWPVKSPLFHESYSYPPSILESPVRDELQKLSATQVHDEVIRVHKAVLDALADYDADPEGAMENAWGPEKTVRSHLSYLPYHAAYHTGQIFLTRHVLGESTPG